MTEDTEPYRADKTVGPESGNGGPDDSGNGKGTVLLSGDEPSNEHTGPKNGENKQGQSVSDGDQTNKTDKENRHKNKPSGQTKNTDAIVEELKKQLQETQEKLIAATTRAGKTESKLRKTEEDLSKARQSAEDPEKERPCPTQKPNTSSGKTNEAESKLKKTEEELTGAQTALTESTNLLQSTKDELTAAKKRARDAVFELNKTKEDCIRVTTRANNAESEVQYLLSKIEEWKAWEKEQQQLAQQSSKNSRNAAATVADLKKQLKETKQKLDDTKKKLDDTKKELVAAKTNSKTEANLKKQLQDTKLKLDAYKADASVVQCRLGKAEKDVLKALQRADDAENERARLFKMLNGATIQRDNRSPPGSFPDGDQITKMATKAAILTWEYLMDISDFLDVDPLDAAKSGLWRAVEFAEDAAEARVVKKTEHLVEFIEGEIPPEESLGHLFWKQTMQHVMKQKLDKPYDSFFAEWVSSDEQLKAIVDMDEKHKDELEGRNIGAFMELHFKLRIACRFSDPECFLWPAVGTTVPFSSKHHNQQKTPDKRKRKAKAGESVHVVYPGLYFRHPEEPDCEPVVRAMVAVL